MPWLPVGNGGGPWRVRRASGASGPDLGEEGVAGWGERHQRDAPVGRVGPPHHQAGDVELIDDLGAIIAANPLARETISCRRFDPTRAGAAAKERFGSIIAVLDATIDRNAAG